MRASVGMRSDEHGDGVPLAARRRILARTAVASGVVASAVGGVLAVQGGGGGSMAADAASAAVRTIPAPVAGQDLADAAGVMTPSFLGDIASVASLVISVVNVLELVKGGGDSAVAADK
jgi:hypothetical protein